MGLHWSPSHSDTHPSTIKGHLSSVIDLCNKMIPSASILHPSDSAITDRSHSFRVDAYAEEGEEHDMSNARAAVATGVKTKSAPRARRQPAGPPRRATDKQAKTTQLSEFAELYDQYFPKVFAYVSGRVQDKEISLDIVSDVFEKAYIKGHAVREAAAYMTWLFMIAKNVVIGHYRRHKREIRGMDRMRESLWISEPSPDPEDDTLQSEAASSLLRHLRRLSKRDQELIALKFEGELSYAEISAVLGLSEVNVRVSIFRALKRLRRMMEEEAL